MIRRSLLTDLAAINAFDIFAGSRLLEIADDHMLVAEVDGEVVGYVSWVPRGFIGRDYITHLGVAPAFQRRGFGRALLQAAEAAIGAGRLFASTNETTSRCSGFYRSKAGYPQARLPASMTVIGRNCSSTRIAPRTRRPSGWGDDTKVSFTYASQERGVNGRGRISVRAICAR